MGATGDSERCQRWWRCWRRWWGGWSPSFRLFFFYSFLPQIPLLSSSPQSSRAHWLRDCLSPPSPAAPPQRRDFPQRWWVAEPPRLLRPGREGVIDQTWREAGWQPLRCARPARPAPAAPAAAQRSGLRSAGAHRPHVGRPPGCSCPFKAASARCVCVYARESAVRAPVGGRGRERGKEGGAGSGAGAGRGGRGGGEVAASCPCRCPCPVGAAGAPELAGREAAEAARGRGREAW